MKQGDGPETYRPGAMNVQHSRDDKIWEEQQGGQMPVGFEGKHADNKAQAVVMLEDARIHATDDISGSN